MNINLVSCLFVLDSEKNDNIRKNDIKKMKILVTKENSLPKVSFNSNGIKTEIRKHLKTIIGSNIFHLEQAFTMDYKNTIDIIYFGATNIENIKKLDKDYKLIDFNVIDNSTILFDEEEYKYKTIEKIENNNIEYIHQVDVKDEILNRNLLEILICYKKIRSNIDNTDILFKFMGNYFTLEDVRILYELIKETKVDKSNFRKKIIKYCEKVNVKETTKLGYRPSQKYKFKPLKGDVWL